MLRPTAALLVLGLLCGCASATQDTTEPPTHSADATRTPTPPAPAATPAASNMTAQDTLTLGIGETGTLVDNSRLSYLRLVNDSRCPPDVQCIQAGDAEIELRWHAADGSSQTFSLHTNRRPGPTEHQIGSHRLSLVALERGIAPKATLRIAPVP